MKNTLKLTALVGILLLNAPVALANQKACEAKIKRFVTTTYKMNNTVKVKKVRHPREYQHLGALEKKALGVHLKIAGVKDLGFEDGNRHAVSTRNQTLGGKKWLVIDVTSDNRMGLTRTIQIYEVTAENLAPRALYHNDHYNPAQYRCQR